MKDIAVAAGAACAEEFINDDCSNRISVSLQRGASMIASDVLPGKAASRRSMLDIVLAKSTIKLLFMFQHWQYPYGETIRIQVFADESLNLTPNSWWRGLQLYGFRGGAVPLLLQTFVPTRAAGWSPFWIK
jgi:hypothetical protein